MYEIYHAFVLKEFYHTQIKCIVTSKWKFSAVVIRITHGHKGEFDVFNLFFSHVLLLIVYKKQMPSIQSKYQPCIGPCHDCSFLICFGLLVVSENCPCLLHSLVTFCCYISVSSEITRPIPIILARSIYEMLSHPSKTLVSHHYWCNQTNPKGGWRSR